MSVSGTLKSAPTGPKTQLQKSSPTKMVSAEIPTLLPMILGSMTLPSVE
jgi:hypothetical protein